MRFTEIAETLELPASTVKSRFHYGIERLKPSCKTLPKNPKTMKTDKTMTCRRFREQLDELLAGTLSDAERRSMEEHAAACEACAAALRDARRRSTPQPPTSKLPRPQVSANGFWRPPADDWPSREANPDRPHPPSPNLPWQPTFQQQSRTQPRAPRPAA